MSSAPHSAAYIDEGRLSWWKPDFLRMCLNRVGKTAFSDVCEIGVGAGHWLELLSHAFGRFDRVLAIDNDPHWVATASARLPQLGVARQIKVMTGDAASLNVADGRFDLVTCQTLLMHVQDPISTLREMKRVTKPGGVILVSESVNVINRSALYEAIRFLPPKGAATLLGVWLEYHQAIRSRSGFDYDIGLRLPELFSEAGLTQFYTFFNEAAEVEVGSNVTLAWMLDELARPDIQAVLSETLDDSTRSHLTTLILELERKMRHSHVFTLSASNLVLAASLRD